MPKIALCNHVTYFSLKICQLFYKNFWRFRNCSAWRVGNYQKQWKKNETKINRENWRISLPGGRGDKMSRNFLLWRINLHKILLFMFRNENEKVYRSYFCVTFLWHENGSSYRFQIICMERKNSQKNWRDLKIVVYLFHIQMSRFKNLLLTDKIWRTNE